MVRWFDVGQEAHGVVAIGQQATGVIAIGQLATGVVAIGQLAGVGEVGAVTAGPRRLPPQLLLRLVVLAALAAAWWLVPGAPLVDALVDALVAEGGALRPIPMPR